MTEKQPGLRFGPLGEGAVHLCVDMQQMFDADPPWATGWLRKVLPQVVRLCEAHPARTIFTRFIPAESSDDARGSWRRYYRAWEEMTLRNSDPRLLDLVPELQIFVPPATQIDKRTSPGQERICCSFSFHAISIALLYPAARQTSACLLRFLARLMPLRVIVAADALCSSVDETHDAIIDFYHERLREQIEIAEVAEIREAWRP